MSERKDGSENLEGGDGFPRGSPYTPFPGALHTHPSQLSLDTAVLPPSCPRCSPGLYPETSAVHRWLRSHIPVRPQCPMPVGTGQYWELIRGDFARSSGRQWHPVTGTPSTRLLHLCAQKSCPLSSGAHLSPLHDHTQASSVQGTSRGCRSRQS